MEMEQALGQFLESRSISYKDNRQSFVLERCPRCSGDKCYIRKRDGRSICFSGSCGSKWSYKGIVAELTGVHFNEAHKILFGSDLSQDAVELKIGFSLSFDPADEEEEIVSKPVALGFDFIPVEKSDVAIRYLAQRNILDPELIIAYDIRYQALMNAIVFPIRKNGILYGWQARSIPPLREGQLRLIFPSLFNKSQFLLNYDRARYEKNLIISEGPVDCINAEVPGFGSVCSFGKAVSLTQVKMILESDAENVYVGLDRDAWKEAEALVELLSTTKKVYRLFPPAHRKDLGECTKPEILQAIASAVLCEAYPASRLELFLKS